QQIVKAGLSSRVHAVIARALNELERPLDACVGDVNSAAGRTGKLGGAGGGFGFGHRRARGCMCRGIAATLTFELCAQAPNELVVLRMKRDERVGGVDALHSQVQLSIGDAGKSGRVGLEGGHLESTCARADELFNLVEAAALRDRGPQSDVGY